MNTNAVDFFREHAGYSWNPATETQEQGRTRCARELADAEQWLLTQDFEIDWEEDDDPHDRTGIDHNEPLWRCALSVDGEVQSLHGIDLGESWDDAEAKAYKRVVRAELAQELRKQIN